MYREGVRDDPVHLCDMASIDMTSGWADVERFYLMMVQHSSGHQYTIALKI